MNGLDPRGTIVQALVRKPTGGSKGITRSLAALVKEPGGMKRVPLAEVVRVDPVGGTSHAERRGGPGETTMELPFNLSLTEDQRRRRGEVPLPYAHEGEGARSVVGTGMDWADEEDEDDEEI